MKASDLLVSCLEKEGIEYIFGVPGEENADFMLSLENSTQIKFILTRHEQGAAFMAEAYGRLTGNPAVCLSTLGPGASNLITGVADANMDRAPVLVLTGQGSTERLHKESHQIMDVVHMFEPVTKWAISIRHANTIPEIVRKAVRLARGEKPGAVHIELPEDIARMDTSQIPMTPRRFERPVSNPTLVKQALGVIEESRRPIILVGNGCVRRHASAALREFCQLTGIGVVSTFMAKGCIDVDSENFLFTAGLGAKDFPNLAIDDADLVITLGFDMVEYHPRIWNNGCDKRIIHADFQPAEIDRYYHPEVELVGDLANTLGQLNERIHLEETTFDFDLTFQHSIRKMMQDELAQHADDETVDSIRPQKALWDTRKVMGPNDILLSDVGAHKMWIARHFHCHTPNTCLIPNGYCSMGFALPGAIAASLVYPERRIMAIAGDGGFLMNVQEMETAKRLGSNIVMMVWEDGGYGLISWKQQAEFNRHTDLSFGNPDWIGLAQSFGWNARLCRESAKLEDDLRACFAETGPSLLVIPIDYRENQKLTDRLATMHKNARIHPLPMIA
jgi:acetolactate synthase-1/2/3 large subunit